MASTRIHLDKIGYNSKSGRSTIDYDIKEINYPYDSGRSTIDYDIKEINYPYDIEEINYPDDDFGKFLSVGDSIDVGKFFAKVSMKTYSPKEKIWIIRAESVFLEE